MRGIQPHFRVLAHAAAAGRSTELTLANDLRLGNCDIATSRAPVGGIAWSRRCERRTKHETTVCGVIRIENLDLRERTSREANRKFRFAVLDLCLQYLAWKQSKWRGRNCTTDNLPTARLPIAIHSLLLDLCGVLRWSPRQLDFLVAEGSPNS